MRVLRNLLHPLGRKRYLRKAGFPLAVGGCAALAFGATHLLASDATAARVVDVLTQPVWFERAPKTESVPLRVELGPRPALRDQYFRNCREAHSVGRFSIPSWDPSYRSSMDGDGDGLACEPYRSMPSDR